jgi:hypothetical protein
MVLSNIAWALFCALGFVGWGAMCKYTGMSHRWISVIVYVSALAAIAGMNVRPLFSESLPPVKMAAVMAVFGGLNGLAVYFYAGRLSKTEVDPTTFMIMVFAFMVLETPVVNWIIYRNIPNMDQVIACGLAIGAGYFLNR